jgi:alpha-galactosidase
VVLLRICIVEGYDNGVDVADPIRGWTTWCTNDLCGLRDKCTAHEIKKRADSLVSEGLKDLGYKWILLDDCWADTERDANSRLQPAPKQFPAGMEDLVSYVHNLGLKIGLYTCIGTETCKKGRPGSYGHYEIDAQTFADWQVDMVKVDNCNKPGNETQQDLFTEMSKALNATGRPMLYAICNWGEEEVYNGWGREVAQQFRIAMDHLPFFHYPGTESGAGYGGGVSEIIEYMADLPTELNQPYGWFDPDFLETLMPGFMSFTSSRTEFTFWSLFAAPLLVATDVTDMSDEKRSILMNQDVLNIHWDSLYAPAKRIINNNAVDGSQVWKRDLLNGDYAIVYYNSNNDTSVTISSTFNQLGLKGNSYSLVDLWKGTMIGTFTDSYSVTLDVHDVQFIRASAVTN